MKHEFGFSQNPQPLLPVQDLPIGTTLSNVINAGLDHEAGLVFVLGALGAVGARVIGTVQDSADGSTGFQDLPDGNGGVVQFDRTNNVAGQELLNEVLFGRLDCRQLRQDRNFIRLQLVVTVGTILMGVSYVTVSARQEPAADPTKRLFRYKEESLIVAP